jgi:hypothetical protein
MRMASAAGSVAGAARVGSGGLGGEVVTEGSWGGVLGGSGSVVGAAGIVSGMGFSS